MHEDLQHLDRLDTLDREHWKRESRIHQLRSELAETGATLAARQAALAQAEAALEANRVDEKAVQRKLTEYRGNRASATRLLETGMGDPEAAQRQVDRCDELIDDAETSVLELLQSRDGLTSTRDAAAAEVAETRDRVETLKRDVPAEVATLEGEMAGLVADRSTVFEALPRDIKSRYDGWRARRKWAVARIVRGACDACRMEVQSQHLSDLKRGLIVPCRGCHRWLIPPE